MFGIPLVILAYSVLPTMCAQIPSMIVSSSRARISKFCTYILSPCFVHSFDYLQRSAARKVIHGKKQNLDRGDYSKFSSFIGQ
jgi:hypothetical protein